MKEIVQFIKSLYPTKEYIPLHEPSFIGKEKEYLCDCIDSTYVSSVGKYVDSFEKSIQDFTGSKYCVAIVNGTQALYLSLKLLGVGESDEVITQSATFIATSNAIKYTGADCSFVDIDDNTFGMNPDSLADYFSEFCISKDGLTYNKKSGKKISAVVPMHTFGFPCRMDEIHKVCKKYGVKLIEDAAESLGSFYKGRHTGTLGDIGILSFNGNKIITTGGGGMILTNDETLGKRAKHLSTTAKIPHKYEFIHDEIGYNFRMPNLNAAIGLSQMENIERILLSQKKLANKYSEFFKNRKEKFTIERNDSNANYWLNSILFENTNLRDEFLDMTNLNGVMTRTLWKPMHLLPMFENCNRNDLTVTEDIYNRLVNLPSTPII